MIASKGNSKRRRKKKQTKEVERFKVKDQSEHNSQPLYTVKCAIQWFIARFDSCRKHLSFECVSGTYGLSAVQCVHTSRRGMRFIQSHLRTRWLMKFIFHSFLH